MNGLVLVALHLLSATVYGGINDGYFEMMIEALKEDVLALQRQVFGEDYAGKSEEEQLAVQKQQEPLVKRIETLENGQADLVRWKRTEIFDASLIWPHVPEQSKAWLVDRLEEEGWFGDSQASPLRCYRGRRGDASVQAHFHKGCDNKGQKTVTFIMAHDDSIFGAVTSEPWKKITHYEANDSFLISLKFGKEATRFKLPVKPDNQFAMRGNQPGPTFGGGADIYVGDKCLTVDDSIGGYSNVGTSYEKPKGEQQSYMMRRDGYDGWQFTKSTDDIKNNLFKCKGIEVWYLP